MLVPLCMPFRRLYPTVVGVKVLRRCDLLVSMFYIDDELLTSAVLPDGSNIFTLQDSHSVIVNT